jgi:hypothetical protein
MRRDRRVAAGSLRRSRSPARSRRSRSRVAGRRCRRPGPSTSWVANRTRAAAGRHLRHHRPARLAVGVAQDEDRRSTSGHRRCPPFHQNRSPQCRRGSQLASRSETAGSLAPSPGDGQTLEAGGKVCIAVKSAATIWPTFGRPATTFGLGIGPRAQPDRDRLVSDSMTSAFHLR